MNRFPWRALLAAAGGYVLLSAAAVFLPLLRDIGYEYSLLLAVAGSVTAALTTASIWGDPRSPGSPGVIDAAASLRRSLAVNGTALAFPLAFIAGATIAGRACSFGDSLSFFLLLPVVSVWFSTALAAFGCVLFRKPRLMFFLLAAVSLVYALLLGYATPALHTFNFFYGYFPGFTYDELLEVSTPLVLFRIFTALLGGGIIWMALLLAGHSRHTLGTSDRVARLVALLREPRRLPVTLALLLLVTLATAFREELGFESSAGFIARNLGATTETAHFRIHHPPELAGSGEIERIAGEHEFFFGELVRTLPFADEEKIVSFIYPSAAVRRSFIGSGVTNIAKPWRREINTTVQSVDGVLEHELVHVFAGPHGLPVLRISPSIGLTEGLAVATEKTWGTRSLHRTAAAVRRAGLAPDIRGLLTITGFAAAPSSLGYALAGSFTGYLQSTYGMERLLEVYGSTDYAAVFGKTLDELVGDWERFLDGQDVDAADRAAVDALFRRPAIFRKYCPRAVARGNRTASGLFRDGRYAEAADLYGRLYRESAGLESLGGYLASSLRAGRTADVTAFHDSTASRAPDVYLTLGVVMGDALWAAGRTKDAAALFERIRVTDPLRWHTEAASVRLYALRDARLAAPVLRYLLAFRADSAALPALDSLAERVPDDPLPLYLAGKHLLRWKRYREAHEAFAWAGEIVRDSVLEYERLMGGGQALVMSGRRSEALEAFRRAFLYARNDVQRRETYLWTRRCEAVRP